MKPIDKDELYEHLSSFLRSKGIDLKHGSYTHRIQKSCTLLTDAINLSQSGLKKAKTQIDQKLDQVRQVIHEKTAPKPPPAAAEAAGAGAPSATAPNAAPTGQQSPPAQPSSGTETKTEDPIPKRARKGKSQAEKRKHG